MQRTFVFIGALAVICGCQSNRATSYLSRIYDEPAQRIGDERNPVVVIPGILGSKLIQPSTGVFVWGAFTQGAADADTAEGARLVALPMQPGVPLADLRDDTAATEVLDTLKLDIAVIRGVEFAAYSDILKTLAAGKYRDRSLGESGAVHYDDKHYTCFQFPYDWRRDISEQSVQLHRQIQDAIAAARSSRGSAAPRKVDVVAHSMGGLLLRYYLMHGPHPLPADGSLPPVTWEGARYVQTAISIGTPHAGSAEAVREMIQGVRIAPLITPRYRPAVLGTMPALYELFPRPRHARVVEAGSGKAIDLLDIETWKRLQWGLASASQDRVLKQLLPDIATAEERRAIAMDHLQKCLNTTRRFFDAIDRPAAPPSGLDLFLVAGDAHDTLDTLTIDAATGRVVSATNAPGDGTVTRASALLDERTGMGYQPRLQSPIRWTNTQFLASNHLGLTRDPLFADFVLFSLLERPRSAAAAEFANATLPQR